MALWHVTKSVTLMSMKVRILKEHLFEHKELKSQTRLQPRPTLKENSF